MSVEDFLIVTSEIGEGSISLPNFLPQQQSLTISPETGCSHVVNRESQQYANKHHLDHQESNSRQKIHFQQLASI